jgi:hypothetical protein
MRSPEMTMQLTADGSEPAEPNTPDQFRAYVARQYEEVEKLLKTLNLKLFQLQRSALVFLLRYS